MYKTLLLSFVNLCINSTVIFEIENNSISLVDMSTIDLHFKLKNLPVLWLGITTEQQSIKKIIDAYYKVPSSDAKETLISAAGMHKSVDQSFNFLKEIIESDENGELKEDAVFWIGHIENPRVIPFLKEVAFSDFDEDVAEEAVFSLHNIDTDESLDAVVYLTKKTKGDVREKAIFWLGQLAGKKAIESLGEIVFSEDETDIQKQAVFALSQLDDGQGIPKLINIANTHPNPEIRKNSIFWLGESDDDRALDALIEMVKK
jgi:HEAT repeat protein